jgi:hypothetical protein
MPEQQDLDLLLPLGAKAEHGELEQSPQRPIEKRTEPRLENDPPPRMTLPVTPRRQTATRTLHDPSFRHHRLEVGGPADLVLVNATYLDEALAVLPMDVVNAADRWQVAD